MMYRRLIMVLCFSFLVTGVSSCPKRNIMKSAAEQLSIEQITGKKVSFNYDDFKILEAGADVLLDVVEVLQGNPEMQVILTGHTDNRGPHEYNLALGAKRADSAKKFMISCAPYLERRIRTASKGETEPYVRVKDDSKNSKYEKQHAKNRRVEFSFSQLKK